MTFSLRPYQQTCHDKLVAYLKSSVEPCLIDAAPAAGKSFLIAAIADFLNRISGGKRVLCLAPSAVLIHQNFEKYLLTGEPASIFSASAGAKSTRHKVVFATPLTVKNSISRFKTGYCAVVIDECHGITPTIRDIIDQMREDNPTLRVIGFSGTPFRLGDGYIYRISADGRNMGADVARDPYFLKCVHRVSAREMLDQGFITPMDIGAINAETYDTSGLHLNKMGQFDAEDVDRAFVGHGRKTAAIVADVIEKSRGRKGGVMLFASTIRHAEEVFASLPPGLSVIVTGNEKHTAQNDDAIRQYKAGQKRYIVSVGKLTTGFDSPHTEVIALLRLSESAALIQQILGRAWRLHPDKETSLLLDYANNVSYHFPDGDIYNPEIKAKGAKIDGKPLKCLCPDCGYENEFSLNPDYEEYQIDENGYCLDVFGARIETDYGPLAAHYGRRCMGYVDSKTERGKLDRCGYYWTSKICEECNAPNDIAARYCRECRAEIVDPNAKLIGEFKAMKRDPTRPQCDEVTSMTCRESISQKGNKTLRVDWVTPFRQFATWLSPDHKGHMQQEAHKRFMAATNGGVEMPKSIAYVKDIESGFFRIMGYNWAIDEAPEERQPLKKSA